MHPRQSMLTRRHLLAAAAGAVLAGPGSRASPTRPLGPPVAPQGGKTVPVLLTAAERPTALPCFDGASLPLWTFAEGAWPPVIRLDLGDTLQATLENRLAEHTSIHWHGIRLPNAQDGVPYLVQPPVQTGERYGYLFTPPDTGTFFFHSHCNTAEQLGRGLEGILIVDGDVVEPYDADTVLLMRDWRVEPGAGRFSSFSTLRGAARAGTYGPLRSVNGATEPQILLPASGDCRLRLLNTDPTRIMRVAIEGADAAILAIDGIAIAPVPLDAWTMGPAMRLDLAVRSPAPGAAARVVDTAAGDRVVLAHLVGTGEPRRSGPFDPAPLRAGRIPAPDLATADRLPFRLQSDVSGAAIVDAGDWTGAPLGPICTTARTFWTINGRAWPSRDHASLPPPLAVLELGRTYVFELRNDTDFSHPIHIHGHTFTVLGSTLQNAPRHHADTLLLLPGEEAQVAFVADNLGDWMFHCHVIEHQEAGMMGYLRVA